MKTKDFYILNVAKDRGFVRIFNGCARYGCPMNDDQTMFKFKGLWYSIADYIFEHTTYDG